MALNPLFQQTLRAAFVSAALLCTLAAQAQLDSIHWMPPVHARGEYGPQYLYLSTPETTPFQVEIRNGAGTVITTLTISNSQPKNYTIGSGVNTRTVVPEDSLMLPLKTRGLILVGPKKFYAVWRAHSDSQFQAGDLTCKGRAALGTTFRIGHLYQTTSENNGRSNFIGVLATEDSTTVTLSDFDPGVDLQKSDGTTLSPNGGPVTIDLKKGESVVFSQYITFNFNAQPPNGLLGALLTSTKPIAVNTGSWTAGPLPDGNDIGIDQIAPFELMGKEYILVKGNGSEDLETPLIIAHRDNTQVWLNGASNATTINAGGYIRVNTSNYSGAGNLYIRASEPVFVYQIIGGQPNGDDAKRTAGLSFVPPISCAIPNAVDNIYQPNSIGSMTFDGGLMIVAMKDSSVTLRINGQVTALGSPSAVPGNPDFVTYRKLSLFSENSPVSTASVVAQGAVQVGLFGRNGAAGFGAFYSGFSKINVPKIVALKVDKSDGICPDTLVARGKFDGVQWFYQDSLVSGTNDSMFIAYAPGQYVARAFLGVCSRTDYVQDTVEVGYFDSPAFPYTLREPSCFGLKNGQVLFGSPTAGKPPYEYSIDNGASFSNNLIFNGIAAGNYTLVVRDAADCYNRPLDVTIGQPDSLGVTASIARIQEPVKPGESVLLEGAPSRPIVSAEWAPLETSNHCYSADCLQFEVFPQETTWYTITVTDTAGCTAEDRVQIVIAPNVYAPNVIWPGSSNGNDRFVLSSKEDLPVNWLRIYDRWGSLIFENQGFTTNDASAAWDGTARGKDLTPGVFVFVAEVEYYPGRFINLRGDVLLIR